MAAFTQFGLAILFYFSVVGIFRLAGKRYSGQTTTFDLIILISLGVALQQVTLKPGNLNALVFIVTVFCSHKLTGLLCIRYEIVRLVLRGRPCHLVRDGEILHSALRSENITVEELQAGLRKMGIDHVSQVKTAHLEETGQISAVRKDSQ